MTSPTPANPVALALPVTLEWIRSPDSFVESAYEAVEKIGFEAGAASKGPFARLNEFLEERVWPHLEPALEKVKGMVSDGAAKLRAYGEAIRDERYSGDVVQRAIIVAAWADALRRVLPGWLEGEFSFQDFTATEWLYLALAVYMFTEKADDE